jgi:peptide/nickel transport system permease protein
MIGAVSPGRFVVRLAIRAALLVVTFIIALVVWGAVAARLSDQALQSSFLTPAQRAVIQRAIAAGRLPAPDVGGALGPSLGPLVLALILGTAVGVALAVAGALADRQEAGRPGAGASLAMVGQLAELPWIAITPFALALPWAIGFGIGAGSVGVLEVIVVGGLVATLVANAVHDPLRRGDHAHAVLSAVGGVGRGVLAGISALVLIEAATNRPGLGRLLLETVITRFVNIGRIVLALLVIGLVGSLLSLAGDGGPGGALDGPRMGRWPLAMLAGLGLPVLLLLVSFAVAPGAAPRFDLASAEAPPSAAHLLGTNQLGQDLLVMLVMGYRNSLGLAVGAALLAAVVGGAWGAAAAFVAPRDGSGGALADVVVAPAWVLAVVPLLPAVIVLRAGLPGLAAVFAISLGLLARLALAVRDLEAPDLTSDTLLRAGTGVFLLCLGAALVVGTGVDALGMGVPPPTASLGRLLADSMPFLRSLGGGTVAGVVLLSVLTAGPCFLAGWALLRPFNRGQIWGRLLA